MPNSPVEGALTIVVNGGIETLFEPVAETRAQVSAILYHSPSSKEAIPVPLEISNAVFGLASARASVQGVSHEYVTRVPVQKELPPSSLEAMLKEFALATLTKKEQGIEELKESLSATSRDLLNALVGFRYHVNFLLNSPGGSVRYLRKLQNLIMQCRANGAQISAFGAGQVDSSASLAFMHADPTRRSLLTATELFFHLKSSLYGEFDEESGQSREEEMRQRLVGLDELINFLTTSEPSSDMNSLFMKMMGKRARGKMLEDIHHDGGINIPSHIAQVLWNVGVYQDLSTMTAAYHQALATQVDMPVGEIRSATIHKAVAKFFGE